MPPHRPADRPPPTVAALTTPRAGRASGRFAASHPAYHAPRSPNTHARRPRPPPLRLLPSRTLCRAERPDLRFGVTVGFWRLWLSEHRSELLLDFMVGITVALAQIPGAIAFAFAAGVAPIIGLYASAILGITTATFGGRPGMVSGATGAVGIVQYNLVTEFNDLSSEEQLEEWGTNNAAEVLWAGLLLMGPIQIILGVTHFGAIVELIGVPTMIGFVNGLAILIARAQLTNFQRFVASATWYSCSGGPR